jgi:8-oxo-dGTP pyrophosphatase MutT (NUDIX family)
MNGFMHLKLKTELPGVSAQLQMAPEHRIPQLRQPCAPENAAHSAVVALLGPRNRGLSREELMDWEVLLIRRNTYPGVHSGQISFPGGKYEPDDGGFWETARREAFEEVGLGESDMEKVGALTCVYVPASNFIIHPFVALNRSAGTVRLDPREVAGYKNIPMRTFDPAAATVLNLDFGRGQTRPAPAWQYEDFTIWGATAMILSELYRLIDEGALARS